MVYVAQNKSFRDDLMLNHTYEVILKLVMNSSNTLTSSKYYVYFIMLHGSKFCIVRNTLC
jgi:hypothetical protein